MYKKKSLGQHFLRTRSYVEAIVTAARIQEGDIVLEIGPGEGVLTEALLERGAAVLAVEKDARLIPILKEKFAGKKFEVVEGDALEFEPNDYKLKTNNYKLVANIPYYITGALFKKFLSHKTQPSLLVFLTQKEVAERVARSKKESILSLSVKAYGNPKYVKTVPRGAFVPPPTVDSAILLVDHVSRKNFTGAKQEERFFDLIKKGFAQKRKLLRSNLGKVYSDTFIASQLPDNTRAEDVSLDTWLRMAKH